MPIYFEPLKPHLYMVKLGFAGVYIIFLICAQKIDCWYSLENIDCGYSLEPPRPGSSNEYGNLDEAVLTSTHNLCF